MGFLREPSSDVSLHVQESKSPLRVGKKETSDDLVLIQGSKRSSPVKLCAVVRMYSTKPSTPWKTHAARQGNFFATVHWFLRILQVILCQIARLQGRASGPCQPLTGV